MKRFDYLAPTSLEEAVTILQENPEILPSENVSCWDFKSSLHPLNIDASRSETVLNEDA